MSKLKIIPEQQSCSTESSSSHPAASSSLQNQIPIPQFKGRAGVVTLGCAKNQVDSEVMLGSLQVAGFEIVSNLKDADVAIINTCGFLQASVKESIDAILDAAEYKKSGRLRKLIVAGCLVERYKGEIETTIKEVDTFVSTDDLLKVGDIAGAELEHILDSAARPYFLYDDTMPRVLSTRQHTAYVKISEGCNRPCTFCIIPRIRGSMRSRTIASVLNEVEDLKQRGVKEINLIAQDLTAYGADLRAKGNSAIVTQTTNPELNKEEGSIVLSELLEQLDKKRYVDWIRLLYAYPVGVDERLLKNIKSLPSLCNYLDIPLQHSAERVLKLMHRPIGRYAARNIVEFMRSHNPDMAIRTTFIVGFPGETEADVDDLAAFVEDGHFLNVGVFTYSPEEGTPSHGFDGHVKESVKKARRERVMKAQQRALSKRLQGYLGQRLKVLVEGVHEETELLLSGRAEFQAPEVDGVVIINDKPEGVIVRPGEFYEVEVTEIAGYDLVGRVV